MGCVGGQRVERAIVSWRLQEFRTGEAPESVKEMMGVGWQPAWSVVAVAVAVAVVVVVVGVGVGVVVFVLRLVA